MVVRDFLGRKISVGDAVVIHIPHTGMELGTVHWITPRNKVVVKISDNFMPRRAGNEVVKVN